MADAFDFAKEFQEYRALRSDNDRRNKDWWTLRQALQGIFRWPNNYPDYKPRLRVNLFRKMVLVHAAYLIGRGFETIVEPVKPTAPARKKATEAERALKLMVDMCGGQMNLNRAAILGSMLGTSGFKTYMEEDSNLGPRACFTAIQPELIYPITRGDDYSHLMKVFYAYTIDRKEAELQYKRPADSFKSARQVEEQYRGPTVWYRSGNPDSRYVVTGNYAGQMSSEVEARRIPVTEIWTPDQYALFVGGEQIENGGNPYGFIPYTLIPNIDAGFGPFGESDVDQILELNEELNEMISDWAYTLKRWANPTLKWVRAPKNYRDIVAEILGGGGVIPIPHPESDINFLEYAGKPPDFSELMSRMRDAGIEVANLNELAFSGQGGGSVNTGASLQVNFTNVTATLSLKQASWQQGLQRVLGQMLTLGSTMGDIGVWSDNLSSSSKEGKMLSGETIGAHRRVKIIWPGLMPKDSEAAARLEIEKMTAGVQSRYTTMENLGVEFPEDELQRIVEEQKSQELNPQGQANLMRGKAALTAAEAKAQGGGAPGDPTAAVPEDIEGDEGVPDDLGQVSDTGEDFGTDSLGQIQDQEGRVLDETGGDLARFFGGQPGGGARPEPNPEEEEVTDEFAEFGG